MDSTEALAKNNRLLRAIPKAEFEQLLPYMDRQMLAPREVLYRQGRTVDYVHFPVSAVLSMVASTADGDTVEVATVGVEGFTGVTAVLSGSQSRRQQGALAVITTLIPGTVIRLKASVFEEAVDRNLELNRCTRRYLSVLFTQLVLAVGCNRLHSLEQRCARWLLNCMDRTEYEEIAVTQELLAQMLGVRRQSVDQILDDLEARQMIQCFRGSIKINDRHRLAAAACECYPISKERLDTFLN